MKLKYRGVEYEHDSPVLEIVEGEIAGKYRGQSWKPHYLKHISVPQPVLNLQYRGAAYTTGQPTPIGAPAVVSVPKPAQTGVVVAFKNRHQLSAELSRVHHINVMRNLEHRLEVARSQGNASLVQMLEAERDQII
jgi:hypothetical protein